MFFCIEKHDSCLIVIIAIRDFYKENEAVVPRLPYFLNISNAGVSMCCEAQGITMSTT